MMHCSANLEMNEVNEKQSHSRILKGDLIPVTGIWYKNKEVGIN